MEFIQGPSTCNQRIERLVDLPSWKTDTYKDEFKELEGDVLLSLDNPFDLWCVTLLLSE